ncbi:MAG: NGG1p interacting factor NIF3 [Methylococcaceae bacterium]|nr:NGG1p interacting factor NIF3 [Methylococcaceae bacterium]
MYKLSFYVPESHLESVKNALFAVGAGKHKAYDQCCWQVRGQGQFRPLANSRPFQGRINQLEKLSEYKVEMVCDDASLKAVVQTILDAHPYEEPAYEIYKILTLDDLSNP